jgi:hypothetical protein
MPGTLKKLGESQCPKGCVADMRVKCLAPSKTVGKSQCLKGWVADLIVTFYKKYNLNEQLN